MEYNIIWKIVTDSDNIPIHLKFLNIDEKPYEFRTKICNQNNLNQI